MKLRETRGATMVEMAIVFPLLLVILSAFIDLALYFFVRTMVIRGNQAALNHAVTHQSIGVDTSTQNGATAYNAMLDECDQAARSALVTSLIQLGNTNAIAYLNQNPANSGRYFNITRPTAGNGETLSDTLKKSPLSVESDFNYKPIFLFPMRLLGYGGTVHNTISVAGFAERSGPPPGPQPFACPTSTPPPGKNSGHSGSCNESAYCQARGCNNCYLQGSECIPCTGSYIASGHACECKLPNCSPPKQANSDCTQCECNHTNLDIQCNERRQMGRAQFLCAESVNYNTCTCEPINPNCDCSNQGTPSCTCTNTQACKDQGPNFMLDAWSCSCINCTNYNAHGNANQDNCTCDDTSACPPKKRRDWWYHSPGEGIPYCGCWCDRYQGWTSDGQGGCVCNPGYTEENGQCKCNVTCNQGFIKVADPYQCSCQCDVSSGYTMEGGFCTVNHCLNAVCNPRTSTVTAGSPPFGTAIIDCTCGNGG